MALNNNTLILSLRKGIYPYEYMNKWERFNESLPEKEDLYSHLNKKDIIDAGYAHAERACKDFETKHFEKYQDLYVQSNTLLFGKLVENFRYVS